LINPLHSALLHLTEMKTCHWPFFDILTVKNVDLLVLKKEHDFTDNDFTPVTQK